MNEQEIFLRELFKKEKINIINNNLQLILNYPKLYTMNIFKELIFKLIDAGYEKSILDNFPKLLQISIEDESIFLIKKTSELKNGKKTLNYNLQNILDKLNGEDLLDALKFLNKKNQNTIIKKNRYSYNLFKNDLISKNTLGCIIKSDMNLFVKLLIKEVSNGKKIYKLGSGTTSDVIKTNEFVIKLGETREKYKIPYHPNILQPLLREKIEDKNGNIIFVAEVQPIVDTKKVRNEHIKKIREKFEKDGIKCFDLHLDNIGLLNKPNKRYLFDGVGGFTDSPKIKTKTLAKGTPVVLDTDLLERE